MEIIMPDLVTTATDALNAIRKLNDSVPNHPDLAERLGQAHAYYILEQENGEPLFGFSKFVGYKSLSPEQYLSDYQSLDGRNTEHALSPWFEELTYASPEYQKYYEKLTNWLAGYGKRPRGGEKQKTRLMVLRPEFSDLDRAETEDRKLLDLMIAVADLLPANQRHELRAVL